MLPSSHQKNAQPSQPIQPHSSKQVSFFPTRPPDLVAFPLSCLILYHTVCRLYCKVLDTFLTVICFSIYSTIDQPRRRSGNDGKSPFTFKFKLQL